MKKVYCYAGNDGYRNYCVNFRFCVYYVVCQSIRLWLESKNWLFLPLYHYSYPFLPTTGGEIVTTDSLDRAVVLSWVCLLLLNLDQSVEKKTTAATTTTSK